MRVKNPAIKTILWSFSPLPDRAQFWLSHLDITFKRPLETPPELSFSLYGLLFDLTSSLRMQPRLNCLPIVRTVWADFISGFGKVAIIISVFTKSALQKMYGLHIAAVAYSLCLNALGLHSDLVKTSFIRHYIMQHIFKWYFALTIQILCIQQITPMENVWLAQRFWWWGADGIYQKNFFIENNSLSLIPRISGEKLRQNRARSQNI